MSAQRRAGAAAPAVTSLFWPAFALALAILAVFSVIDVPLRTPVAANGIISFELASSASAAQAILDSWDVRARLYAAFGLGLDFLYMPSYALAIGLAALWAGRQLGARRRWLIRLGAILAWGLGAAALLDATENFALTKMLLAGTATAPWPAVSATCATIKFGLVIAGLAYALAGAVAWAVRRLARR